MTAATSIPTPEWEAAAQAVVDDFEQGRRKVALDGFSPDGFGEYQDIISPTLREFQSNWTPDTKTLISATQRSCGNLPAIVTRRCQSAQCAINLLTKRFGDAINRSMIRFVPIPHRVRVRGIGLGRLAEARSWPSAVSRS
jgi:hypothetical protein